MVVCAHSEGFGGRGNAEEVPGPGTRGSVRSLDSSAPSLIYHSKLCEDLFKLLLISRLTPSISRHTTREIKNTEKYIMFFIVVAGKFCPNHEEKFQ